MLSRARHIERAPRLAVGLRSVVGEPAPIVHQLADQARQIADRDLPAAAKIYGFRPIVSLASREDAFGGVLNVEELARWRPVSPQNDLVAAGADRLLDLADERGDD